MRSNDSIQRNTQQGWVWLGSVRYGVAMSGTARLGIFMCSNGSTQRNTQLEARLGLAGRGPARQGMAWQGEAGRGKAWQGFFLKVVEKNEGFKQNQL